MQVFKHMAYCKISKKLCAYALKNEYKIQTTLPYYKDG